MKKILMVLTLLLLMDTSVQCEDQPLRLTIKADKEVFVSGEETKITLFIKNMSKKDVIYGLRPILEQPDYEGHGRMFFQNGENVIVRGQLRGELQGRNVERFSPDGSNQMAIVLKPTEEYSQTFAISHYFEFSPDKYEIYFENAMTERLETYLKNVQRRNQGAVLWTGTLASSKIMFSVSEKAKQ